MRIVADKARLQEMQLVFKLTLPREIREAFNKGHVVSFTLMDKKYVGFPQQIVYEDGHYSLTLVRVSEAA